MPCELFSYYSFKLASVQIRPVHTKHSHLTQNIWSVINAYLHSTYCSLHYLHNILPTVVTCWYKLRQSIMDELRDTLLLWLHRQSARTGSTQPRFWWVSWPVSPSRSFSLSELPPRSANRPWGQTPAPSATQITRNLTLLRTVWR